MTLMEEIMLFNYVLLIFLYNFYHGQIKFSFFFCQANPIYDESELTTGHKKYYFSFFRDRSRFCSWLERCEDKKHETKHPL